MSWSSLLNESVKGLSKTFCKLSEKNSAALAVSIGLIAWNTWKSERERVEDSIDRVYSRLNRKPPFPV